MGNRNLEVSVYVTDQSLGFFRIDPKKPSLNCSGHSPLEPEVVENGYVKDPMVLFRTMKTLFRGHRIRPRRVRLVLNESNLLIRKFVVIKDELQKKSLDAYLHGQLGRTLHFPFSEAVISHQVVSETEDAISVTAFIADKNLLNDYSDILERLGAREIGFDLPSLGMLQLMVDETGDKLENTMIVTLMERMISIHIVEDMLPIFGMIEECDGLGDTLCEKVENYVERIANYYKFNLRKGKSSIKDVVVINLSERLTNDYVEKRLLSMLADFHVRLFISGKLSELDQSSVKTVEVAAACNLTREREQKLSLSFAIDRLKKTKLYANYLMVLAIAIFSLVSLVYVPYHLLVEDIALEENIILNLEHRLDSLLAEIPAESSYTNVEKDYSNAYDYLASMATAPTAYVADLTSLISGSLELTSYRIDQSANQIILVVRATSETDLYEYLLDIYENYGIVSGTDDPDRWMMDQPTRRFLSGLVMEVIVTYA